MGRLLRVLIQLAGNQPGRRAGDDDLPLGWVGDPKDGQVRGDRPSHEPEPRRGETARLWRYDYPHSLHFADGSATRSEAD